MALVVRVQVRDLNIFGPIISKITGDTDSVTIGHLQEMAPGVSNGHLSDDVQWRI